jgi:hypothetical protein
MSAARYGAIWYVTGRRWSLRGERQRCDGLTRRDFVEVASLALPRTASCAPGKLSCDRSLESDRSWLAFDRTHLRHRFALACRA